MDKTLPTLEALQEEAATFAASLSPKADTATLVTLSGELGAGKTSFTQGLATALGVTEHVTSPTFVLEKIYSLPTESGRGFERLVHIDAYRLDGGDALRPLGFSDIFADGRNLIVIEWPERVQDALPQADHTISLSVPEDAGRIISYGT